MRNFSFHPLSAFLTDKLEPCYIVPRHLKLPHLPLILCEPFLLTLPPCLHEFCAIPSTHTDKCLDIILRKPRTRKSHGGTRTHRLNAGQIVAGVIGTESYVEHLFTFRYDICTMLWIGKAGAGRGRRRRRRRKINAALH